MLILVLCQDLLCSLRQATFPFCFPSYKAKEFGLADTYGLPRLTVQLLSVPGNFREWKGLWEQQSRVPGTSQELQPGQEDSGAGDVVGARTAGI